MKRLARILCASTFGIIAGCASTAREVPGDQVASMRRIGIISIAGNQLRYAHTGLTVFGNSQADVDISTWDLDHLVSQEIAASARQNIGAKFPAKGPPDFPSWGPP